MSKYNTIVLHCPIQGIKKFSMNYELMVASNGTIFIKSSKGVTVYASSSATAFVEGVL